VCCFIYEHEARKFFEMLKERFAKFGLELAEEVKPKVGGTLPILWNN
jgi:hypothetical protein